jgi:uncharacterized protein YwqG
MTDPRRLREYRISFDRVGEGERAVPLDYPDNLGLRSKLGGAPDWVQGEDWPSCPRCNARMTFIAQLDSMEHASQHNQNRIDPIHGDQHFMFGDVGMLYVFFCEECMEPKTVVQCY